MLLTVVMLIAAPELLAQTISCHKLYDSELILQRQQQVKSISDVMRSDRNEFQGYIKTLTNFEHSEAIDFAKKNLDKLGVNYTEFSTIKTIKKENSESEYHEIFILKISSEGDRPLNLLAKSLKEKYATDLFFDPNENQSGILASFYRSLNRIYIPMWTVMSGRVDYALLHEIRHAAFRKRQNENSDSFLNGQIYKPKKVKYWPWSQKAPRIYENYMSFDEVMTWFQDSRFQYKAIIEDVRNQRFEKDKYNTSLETYLNDIVLVAKSALIYNKRLIAEKRVSLTIVGDSLVLETTRIRDNLKELILRIEPAYESNLVIPKQFWRDRLPEELKNASIRDLNGFLFTAKGRAWARLVATESIDQSIKEIEYYEGVVKSYQEILTGLDGIYSETRKQMRFTDGLATPPATSPLGRKFNEMLYEAFDKFLQQKGVK